MFRLDLCRASLALSIALVVLRTVASGGDPVCALVSTDLDPSTVILVAPGDAKPVPGSSATLKPRSLVGLAVVADHVAVGAPALKLSEARLAFQLPAGPGLLRAVVDPVAGPFSVEVDGSSFEAADFDGLAQASFPNANVYVFSDPHSSLPVQMLCIAGDFTEVSIGVGAEMDVFYVCRGNDELFRSPWAVGHRGRRLDDAWYGSGVRVIGTQVRTIDRFLVQGLRHSDVTSPADLLSIRLAVWKQDSSASGQGNKVFEGVWHFGGTLPGRPPLPDQKTREGVELELEPDAPITLLPGEEYRIMLKARVVRMDGPTEGWVTFDKFPKSYGPFPSGGGTFEVTGAYREDSDAFPTAEFSGLEPSYLRIGVRVKP